MARESHFYLDTIEVTENKLSTNIEKGISSEEAKKRLQKYGKNHLEEKIKISMCKIFIRQFKSIVMLLLTVAGIASFFIGDVVESIAVLVVIMIIVINFLLLLSSEIWLFFYLNIAHLG